MHDGQSQKLWGGRFTGQADRGFAEFNQSFSFDYRLLQADIRASIAHCEGLLTAGVVTAAEAEQIKSALKRIGEAGKTNANYFDELPSEDVHSFVEARLVQMIGDAGRKLLDRIVKEKLLTAQAVYGFWPARAEGDDVVVDGTRFCFLRQQSAYGDSRPNRSLADYVAPVGKKDYLGAFAVSAGISTCAEQ